MSGTSHPATPSVGAATYSDQVIWQVRCAPGSATLRHWLYYGTAGYAWTQDNLTRTQLSDNPAGATGGTLESKFPHGTVGRWGPESRRAGAALDRRTRISLFRFGTASVTFPLAGQRFDSNLSVQEVRVGLNYKLATAARARTAF